MATNYPSQIDNDQSLLVASDVFQPTMLTQDVAPADTVINVVSTVGYAKSWGTLVINLEEIFYQSVTPTTFVGCKRGANNTVPQIHKTKTLVQAPIVSSYINNLKDAIIMVESLLGINGNNVAQPAKTNVFTGSQRMGSLVLDTNPTGVDEWSVAGTLDGFDNATLTVSHSGVGINPRVNILGNLQINGSEVGNNIDITTAGMKDDFLTEQSVGDTGWKVLSSNPPSMNYIYSPGYPGIIQLTTANSIAGDYIALCQQNYGFGELGTLNSCIFDSCFIFRLEQTTNTRFRIGFAYPDTLALAVVPPTDGLWLRFDNNSAYGDTTFEYCSVVNNVSTNYSALAVNTNWHKLRIFSVIPGIVQMTLDGIAPLSFSGGQLSGLTMTPFVQLATDTVAANVNVDIDFVQYIIRGLVR